MTAETTDDPIVILSRRLVDLRAELVERLATLPSIDAGLLSLLASVGTALDTIARTT